MTGRQQRSARLLQLGSGEGDDSPRDGFEARLHARIAADGALPVAESWADALGRVARPALTLAAIAMVTTIAIHLWDRRGDDLTLLADGDVQLAALLEGDVSGLFGESSP